MSAKLPALFLGHGSPMNALFDNAYTRSLRAWGERLPRPEAILVVSAHWLTDGHTFVGCTARPRTIHDFYGFPKKLYQVEYPSPGAPEAAALVARTVRKVGVACNDEWGLDHGCWSVLKHLFPAADVPVLQLSLDYSYYGWTPKPLAWHYELGAELAELRRRGVLVIGSGNLVHNLARIDFRQMDAEPYPWAVEFDERVKELLVAGRHRELIEYEKLGPSAALSVPTLEHYLPMLYVLALREEDEPLTFVYEGIQNKSISMRCFQIG